MWQYLFFKMYLDLKDPLTLSGPEQHASEMLKDKQSFTRLMPIKRSLSLERRKQALVLEASASSASKINKRDYEGGEAAKELSLEALHESVRALLSSHKKVAMSVEQMHSKN